MFECAIAHRRSVVALCIYAVLIRCTLFIELYLTHGAVTAHRYTYAPPRSRTSHYLRTFIHCQYLWNDLGDPYSMVWDLRVSRVGPLPLCWPSCSLHFYVLLFSLFLLLFYGLVLWLWGLRTDRVLVALPQPCTVNLFK